MELFGYAEICEKILDKFCGIVYRVIGRANLFSRSQHTIVLGVCQIWQIELPRKPLSQRPRDLGSIFLWGAY